MFCSLKVSWNVLPFSCNELLFASDFIIPLPTFFEQWAFSSALVPVSLRITHCSRAEWLFHRPFFSAPLFDRGLSTPDWPAPRSLVVIHVSRMGKLSQPIRITSQIVVEITTWVRTFCSYYSDVAFTGRPVVAPRNDICLVRLTEKYCDLRLKKPEEEIWLHKQQTAYKN